jgi:hypothetical protein
LDDCEQWRRRGPEIPVAGARRPCAICERGQRGFGTLLLESTFKMINLDYAREGLTCEIQLPLEKAEFAAAPPLSP